MISDCNGGNSGRRNAFQVCYEYRSSYLIVTHLSDDGAAG